MKIRMVETRSSSNNVYDQSLIPRLGLPQIGAILAEQGHDVRIYVETLAPVDMDDLLSADLVGFSTTTATTPPAFDMADKVRQAGIPVVFGGAHVTFLPDEALDHADYIVRGEGHATMVELIEVIEGRREPSDVLGLSYHGADGLAHTEDRPNCPNAVFAELPVPDLSLIVGSERMGDWPVMTQWGCPFNCNFCSVIKMFGRKVRHRPVEAVLDELENVPAGKSVFFYDDNFVVDKKRTKELLRGMKARSFKFPWSAQVRAEVIYKDKRTGEWDTELLDLMRDTFCKMVYVGYESVNPAALEEYNKQQTVEEIEASIRAFHEYGIHVHGMFVLGCDADTVDTIRTTVKFAIRNGVDTVQFLTITPLPGTDFYYEMEAANRIITDDWALYDGHHVLIEPANMTPYELQMESFKGMLRFYAPRRAWKMLAGNVTRELPFLIGLFFKERKLRLALPKIAWMSLSPKNWLKIPKVLSDALDIKHWLRLRDVFLVPFFRRYAFKHTREGLFQPQNQKYIAWLRKLAQGQWRAGGTA